jgi:glycine cleavage system transcriptional repressor
MTLLRGHFAMTLVVRTPASVDEVRRALEPRLSGGGLDVAVHGLAEEGLTVGSGTGYVLSVHGADRPGIVSAITRVVADHGGNITDLTTRLAGALYVLVAEVELPLTADTRALHDDLASAAGGMGVEASLRPAESDVL